MECKILINKLLLTFILLLLPSGGHAQFAEQQMYCAGSCVGGTASAITLAIPNISSASDVLGVHINFKVAAANPSAATIAVGSTTPLPVKKIGASGLIPLVGAELQPGVVESIISDGSEYILHTGTAPPVSLSAPLSYYVATTGSDSNNCLSVSTPCLTIQQAISLTQSINMNGFYVTINVAAGTYAPFIGTALNGSGTIFIIGNTTTPTSVLINATSGEAIWIQAAGYILEGLETATAANGALPHIGACLRAAATVQIKNMAFGTCATAQLWTDPNGYISVSGALSGFPADFLQIVGSAPYHMYAGSGVINLGLTNLQITGTPNFSNAFAYAINLGQILGPYASISGTATGQKYVASYNAIINTNGAGVNYFPGNSAGNTALGGQYN
jgi:hypothetical protein